MQTRPTWDEYFMFIAKVVSTRSTCSSRPTGAVIVKNNRILATGYNGSVPGDTHCIDMADGFCFRRHIGATDQAKYNYCKASHAEANAIVQAAKLGVCIDGAKIYCTLAPCYTCFKLIVSAGITHIYYELKYKSKDKERDKFWEHVIKSSPVQMTQIILDRAVYDYILERVEGVTSERRLL